MNQVTYALLLMFTIYFVGYFLWSLGNVAFTWLTKKFKKEKPHV